MLCTEQHHKTQTTTNLVVGEFAPVYWEPLGQRGERLVIGVLVCNQYGICKAYQTLQHSHLAKYLEEKKTEYFDGMMNFTFNHLNKTLAAGGAIQSLKAPFASMSIGETEAISARTEKELPDRATQLCTLFGRIKPAD